MTGAPATFAQLSRRVREHIGQDFRFAHSVRVARAADLLAHRHGIDASKARLAGMLHDLARLYDAARLIEECTRLGMPIDAFERANPIVLHARLGAALARECFGVRDPDVLSAIEKHTTAAAEMSRLDCAVYVADALEPGRDFSERAAMWNLALRDLRAATGAAVAQSLRYLQERGLQAAPQTLAAAQTFTLPKEPTTFAI